MCPRSIDEESLQKRELELIDTALDIMEREGIAALTIDKLVASVDYSKGTVYGHFDGKEDLLTAACNNGLHILSELFDRAVSFQGSSREKMMAMHFAYLLYSRLHPNQFQLVISAKTPHLFARTSEHRLEEHRQLENALLKTSLGVVAEGIQAGDLKLPPHMNHKQVAFANWAMSFGAISLLSDEPTRCSGRQDLDIDTELFNASNLLLDGLSWRPLTAEHDYEKSLERIKCELFPNELKQLVPNNLQITHQTALWGSEAERT